MAKDLPKKILHIDDDLLLRELVVAIFDGIDGFELMSAENGTVALEILKTKTPDLILLDLSMPEVDGAEFLQTIRSIDGIKGTPVIIITQFGNIEMKGHYDQLGVIGVLHKPIDPQTLIIDIRDIWQSR